MTAHAGAPAVDLDAIKKRLIKLRPEVISLMFNVDTLFALVSEVERLRLRVSSRSPEPPTDDDVLDFLVAYYGFPNRAEMESQKYASWVNDIRDEVKLIQSWATVKSGDTAPASRSLETETHRAALWPLLGLNPAADTLGAAMKRINELASRASAPTHCDVHGNRLLLYCETCEAKAQALSSPKCGACQVNTMVVNPIAVCQRFVPVKFSAAKWCDICGHRRDEHASSPSPADKEQK